MCSKTMFLINKNLSKEETKSKLKSNVIVPIINIHCRRVYSQQNSVRCSNNKTTFVVQGLKQYSPITTKQ